MSMGLYGYLDPACISLCKRDNRLMFVRVIRGGLDRVFPLVEYPDRVVCILCWVGLRNPEFRKSLSFVGLVLVWSYESAEIIIKNKDLRFAWC